MTMKYLLSALSALVAISLTACSSYDANSNRWIPLSAWPSSAPLDEKCPDQQRSNRWTEDCLEWKRLRAADAAAAAKEAAEKRKAREEADLAAYRRFEERQRREQERLEKERIAAMDADARLGYKTLTFESFALDAKSTIGAKVAIHGLYTPKGERIVRDPISAARWIEGSYESPATVIPLAIDAATRDSRAIFLRCQESMIGWCPLVVRGRVKSLTMRNRFGVTSQQIGLDVESVR